MAKVTFSGGRWYVNGAPKDRAGPYRQRARAEEAAAEAEREAAARREAGPRSGDQDPDGGVL